MESLKGIEPSTSRFITPSALSLSYRPMVGRRGVEPLEVPIQHTRPVNYLMRGKFEMNLLYVDLYAGGRPRAMS